MAQVPVEITRLIDQFLNELEINQIHVNEAFLFGSYANGTFNEWSDIDLALDEITIADPPQNLTSTTYYNNVKYKDKAIQYNNTMKPL